MSSCAVPIPLEIVFSFDTTGSMFGYLEEIRGRVQDLIQRLQADIPSIRVAVMAHGDYCDAKSSYVTKYVNLTTDVASLCDFVRTVGRTGGGDAPECYELVLRQIRKQLSWSANSRRAVVLIGDNLPHEAGDPQNKQKIDWKEEVRALAAESVTIYAVQCGNVSEADAFYQTMAAATGGQRLQLADMTSVFDLMMAVCYRESDNPEHLLSGYEKEVRARCGLTGTGMAKDIEGIFAALRVSKPEVLPTPSTTVASAVPKMKKLPSLTKIHKPASFTKAVSVKPRATSKSSPTFKKRIYKSHQVSKNSAMKFKQNNLPLLKRENVPESNFALKWLKWSPWLLALANHKDIPASKLDQYVQRRTRPGYRLKTLSHCRPSKTSQAVFEVAVQGPGLNKRRHVVFSAFSRRSLNDSRWNNRLLRPVASQINRVLGLDFKVYVRFCLLKHPKKTVDVKTDVHKYDYAWRGRKFLRSGARRATKGGLLISE
ncbi:hypothetical protein EGW08_019504 [Elysia chlorotica]|uniref:VWFA domain-containing protein n=1 Tax=Elysia chlorotica TaxID=188477 RepID=A0A433STX9_ELYCH|nr:hypothetical protein EGW08_019504 [Elysia chlorotica]